MANALVFLRCIGKAAANAVGGGFAGDLMFEVLPEIADAAWKWWAADRNPEERRADLAAVAQATPEQVRDVAREIVLEFAPDKPPAAQQALANYLSLVPGEVRKSLRRPADPTGTTVAFDLVPHKGDDLITLLPTKLPRFKPGERPLPGVDWELEELLGVGGFGEVWKARNIHFASVEPVALKFCLDPGAAQYLKNEAAVLDRVMLHSKKEPGFVTLKQTYFSSETPCLEYEYVLGGDLGGLIQEWHRASSKPSHIDITRIFHELARVVGFAHLHGIVHRDLKPANILRQLLPDGQWRLKVADFGIGGLATKQAIHQQTRGTSRGMFLCSALRGSCTPLYAGPQQMRGLDADPRDDVYALGVIWYQMLTGDLTNGRPGGSKWQKRLADNGLSLDLVSLLAECFEDDPQDRVPDAGTLAARLAKLLPSAQATAVSAPPEPKKAEPLVLTPPPSSPPKLPFPEPPPSHVVRQREEAKQRVNRELVLQLAELNAQVERSPNDASLLAQRAELLRLLGKLAEAIADCTEAIRLRPTLAAAYATRGSAYRVTGKLDLAIADCTRAVDLDARNVLALFNRAEAHRLRNETEKAIADCTKAIEIDPAYSWAYGTRGAARRHKNDLEGAIADLNETLRLDPLYIWAWAVRGETHRLMGKYDEAIEDCSEALRLDPGMSLAYATRGAAFRQKADFATAMADLQQALRLKPDYQWARDQLELARKRQR